MKSYNTVLKIAPAFLLVGTIMMNAQQDSVSREKKIDEVVLIGYGAKKKSDLTGSITAITAKDFQEGAVGSPEQLIQGKTAGVQISTGGAPGSGSAIRIRGGSSLNASNDPLIVIDGVPVDNGGINGAANPLALINPNDIESFNILKDASATAIYGNRASNGVIIITTKRGKAGGLRVNFNTVTSVNTRMGSINMLSPNEFRDVVRAHAAPSYSALLSGENTDWQKQIYQTALGFDNNLSISGGIKGLPYRLSLGYLNQDGILRTNNIERSTVGLNLNPKLFDKHLDININLKGTYAENRFADGGSINAAAVSDPTRGIYNRALTQLGGYNEWMQQSGGLNTNATKNPLSMLNQRYDLSYVRRVLGNVQFDYKFHFLPELRANLNLGMDYADSNGSTMVMPTAAIAFNDRGSNRRYTQEKQNKLLEFYLNYNKSFAEIKSDFDLTAGYSYQDWQRKEPFAPTYFGTGIINPASGVDFFTQNTLISYFGRLNYTFDKKYLLTASLRRDASSRFSPDNRVGYFPAVALAWRLDQENFLKDNSTISTLKLRLGWGKTGQQDLDQDYPYMARYDLSNSGSQYLFGSQFYQLIRPLGYDPNIKWETQDTRNIGLDFGFLNNRISGTFDYFQKDIRDLLSVVPVAAGANLTNLLLTNVGNMTNKGFELNLNVIPVKKENFTWEFSANATHFNPVISNLSNTNNPDQRVLVGGIEGSTGNTIQVHSVGHHPRSFLVYQQVYDQAGKPLEGVYVDRNGDGVINERDLYAYKSPTPDLLLGFSNNLTYKNWDFGFTLRASIGNYVYNNAASQWGNLQGIANNEFLKNIHRSYNDTGFTRAEYFSDYYVENASFLRMDNMSLGYNFPKFVNNGKLRVYATAQNVFDISKYSGVDPEVFDGIDNGIYQRPKIYSIGFNFQF